MAASCPGSWVGQWRVAGPQQEQMNRLLPAQAESLPSPAEEACPWEHPVFCIGAVRICTPLPLIHPVI